jgi:hypothetical protein
MVGVLKFPHFLKVLVWWGHLDYFGVYFSLVKYPSQY